MTSKELMEKYRACGSQELPVLLHFLADHWHALRLADGQKLHDSSDSSLALRELAEAWKFLDQRVYNVDFCPDSGLV